jgi:hypothetical protein
MFLLAWKFFKEEEEDVEEEDGNEDIMLEGSTSSSERSYREEDRVEASSTRGEEEREGEEQENFHGKAAAAVLGAAMVTPPKVLSKMGAQRRGGRVVENKTTFLDDLLYGVSQDRKKKVRDKKRFDESGWRRIEDLARWRWTYSKVPSEKRELLVDMQGQGRGSAVSRLGVFSLYFSDELLCYLLHQREGEMTQFWSPYGMKTSLKIIKQVSDTLFLLFVI